MTIARVVSYSKEKTRRKGTLKIEALSLPVEPLALEVFP